MTTSARAPLTKTARHAKIIALLEQHQIRSQTELADLLAADGMHVTQGTLSRDLVDVGALRVRGSGGHLVYAVPGDGGDRSPQRGEFASFEARLARLCQEVLVSAEPSATSSSSGHHRELPSTSPRRSTVSVGTPSSARSPATTRFCSSREVPTGVRARRSSS